MQPQYVSAPISEIPFGAKLYPIRTLTLADIHACRAQNAILATSSHKPVTGEIAKAYATMIRKMIAGDYPELTDDFIISWLSAALCTMVALEWQRQFFALAQFKGA